MADVLYKKPASPLCGQIQIPGSKSAMHRRILTAALTGRDTVIEGADESADMEATLRGVRLLGMDTEYLAESRQIILSAPSTVPSAMAESHTGVQALDCGESGTTLRLLIPIFAALGRRICFTGSGLLPRRPIGIYEMLLPEHGVAVKTTGGLPFEINGQLQSGTYSLPGNVSSQFISGLLLALPLLKSGSSRIVLTSPLESAGYVELTLRILADSGIVIHNTQNGWTVPGRQHYLAENPRIEGDWSHAAFFLSHAAVSAGGAIDIRGLDNSSIQGDRACAEIYRRFGLHVEETESGITAFNKNAAMPYRGLKAIHLDASQIPDLVPAIAVCAAFAQGQTRIYNAGRLRLKESDRLQGMADAINAVGGKAEAAGDELIITGSETLGGGSCLGLNDHRILMAMSAAGLGSLEPVRVTDAESIRKSYPNFYRDYRGLGGIADVISMG